MNLSINRSRANSFVFLFFFLTLLTGTPCPADADFIHFQDNLQPVRFYAVDDNSDPDPDGDNQVTLTGFQNLPDGWVLQWLDSGTWTTIADPAAGFTVITGPDDSDDWELVSLRIFSTLIPPPVPPYDDKADLTFQTPEGDLWNAVRIDWDETNPSWFLNFTLLNAGGDDNVAFIPLPGSGWLVFFGLLAVIGMRRRFGLR